MLDLCLGTFIFCQQPVDYQPEKIVFKVENPEVNWEFDWITVCRYSGDWHYDQFLDVYVLKCANQSGDSEYNDKINMFKVTYKF